MATVAVHAHHRVAPTGADDALFETIAEAAFRHYARVWKPGTLAVNRSYLANQILPWFGGRPIADVTRAHVRHWFASLHATPAAADRSLPILSAILRHAEIHGYRPEGGNPCLGIRRYRRRGRERFLTLDEYRRLGTALAAREGAAPVAAAAVRLLLLTGCRQGEVRTLHWRDCRAGHLFLRDGKTGPRTVWLSSPARSVLDRLPRTGRWILPASNGDGPMTTDTLYGFWRRLRTAADLPGLRLHDLRHSYASFALRRGETVLSIGRLLGSLPVVSRLLGHTGTRMTLRYAHVSDRETEAAAERVGVALASVLAEPPSCIAVDSSTSRLARPEAGTP